MPTKLTASTTLPSLLIVDDDPLVCEGLAVAFSQDFNVLRSESRPAAIALLRKLPSPPQLALIDLGLPPIPHRPDEGFQLITELLIHAPSIKIFVLSGQNEQSNARHARVLGAIDFIAKPCTPEKIKTYLDDALAVQQGESLDASRDEQSLGLVGHSLAVEALRNQIMMYATMPFPVLIQGESGSGKELVAAALQKLGGISAAPFKVLNCAALSPTLIEPTLFGYCKGAFTGATSAQAGYFEDAADGTLFLDEIGELPYELQAKLLRVLENGEYQRVGETTTRKSTARIIAATNRNMRDAVRAGTFRGDLYHRLNVFSINVPPLRELGQDKLVLLKHFRAYYTRQIKQTPFELHADAFRLWEQYHFPGNTRELRNIVIRLAAKYAGQTVSAVQLQDEFEPIEGIADRGQKPEDGGQKAGERRQRAGDRRQRTEGRKRYLDELGSGNFDLDQHLREQEGEYIAAALELASGNISVAAKMLGINRTTLHSRMDAHEKLKA